MASSQQATKYLYTSTVNGSWQTAAVYPDSTDTLSQDSTTKVWTIASGTDHTATQYDRLGRVHRHHRPAGGRCTSIRLIRRDASRPTPSRIAARMPSMAQSAVSVRPMTTWAANWP